MGKYICRILIVRQNEILLMETNLSQCIRKPISTLTTKEKQLCYQHIGIETLQSGGYLGSTVIHGIWKPKQVKITLVFHFRRDQYSIHLGEKTTTFKEAFTIEDLEKALIEMND